MEIMQPLDPHKVDYPKITLWNKDISEKEKLKIINPGDFPKNDILNGLGINHSSLAESFGITNPDEIKNRQSLIELLIKKPDVKKFILGQNIPSNLPDSREDFLKFFDPIKKHNPYWQKVRCLINLINKSEVLPPRIKTLIETLEISLPLEADERRMAEFISERITNITVIEGIMEFEMHLVKSSEANMAEDKKDEAKPKNNFKIHDLEHLSSHIHGHKMYSFALTDAKNYSNPDWTKKPGNPLNWIGIGKFVKWYTDRRNSAEKKKAYNEMVINKASDNLIEEINNGVLERLRQLNWTEKKLNDSIVKVYFSYSDKGLRLQIYRIVPPEISIGGPFSFHDFPGYSKDRLKEIMKARTDYRDDTRQHIQSIEGARLLFDVKSQEPDFFKETFEVKSPKTDKEHQWFALTNLYNNPKVKKVYEAVLEHRNFLQKHIYAMKEVADVAITIENKAKSLKTPICFPKIVDDSEHVVAFDEIFPIHLLPSLNGERPVPIRNLAPINGQVVALTGTHGGGKTVAALSVIDNIFLAQSGLPVFGKGFELNPKEILGLVFIERGKGSTCEMLLGKINNILSEIKNKDGRKIVLILDELGSATQEISGRDLGIDLLSKLSNKNISVLFSTQIQELAEYVKFNLKGICYKLNTNHQMTLGIGDGELDNLRKDSGFDKLLKRI